jgi:RNA polymerase sigma-70 factor (ECF subfamily)
MQGFEPCKPPFTDRLLLDNTPTRTLPPGASVEETEINGEPALIAKAGTRVVVAIMVDTDGECIRRVFGVANPDKLQALAG